MRSKNSETAKQIEDFVNSYYEANLRTPTLREIESSTGVSRQTVQRYLKAMNDDGRLKYGGRGGIITDFIEGVNKITTMHLPILGHVICGEPEEAVEQIEGHIDFPIALLGSGEYFALRAYGDSMTGAGVNDGDLVIVRKQQTAQTGEIIVAIDDEGRTTLKRLAYDGTRKRYYLHPENEEMADIYPDEIRIQGVATKVVKDLK